MKTILLLISDQNMSLLIGLGSGVIGLLTVAIPLIFKFMIGQQDLKKELIHNTKVTVAASEKIDIANDISGKLLSTNKNIAQNQENIRKLQEQQAASTQKG